jgi:hypothetical protein
MQLKPHPLHHIYQYILARALEQSAAPSLTLLESEVKCLLFADDLMLLSPSKEGLQQNLDLLRRFCQIWALKVNFSKTKIMVFQKGPVPRTKNTNSIYTPLP